MQRKPTGETPFFEFQGGRVHEHRVDLPSGKAEIEDWILNRALRSAARAGMHLFGGLEPLRNDENHFDYTVPTTDGAEYVDLMEVFVLPKGTTGPHAGASRMYGAHARAEEITRSVLEKSSHYGPQARPVHLLLYSTDWRLHLPPSVAKTLAVALSQVHHVFATITYFRFFEDEHGWVFPLWPLTSEQLLEYQGQANREVHIMLPDSSELEVRGDGLSITVDITKLRNE